MSFNLHMLRIHFFKVQTLARLTLLGISFLCLDFHELWHRVMSICLFAEVIRQWAMLALGWVTV